LESSSVATMNGNMVDLEYHVIEMVYQSWKAITTIPDYPRVVGELLFRK